MNLYNWVKLQEAEAENARLRKALIEIKERIEALWPIGPDTSLVPDSPIWKIADKALEEKN